MPAYSGHVNANQTDAHIRQGDVESCKSAAGVHRSSAAGDKSDETGVDREMSSVR
jgi:hypothetical protein